VQLPTAFTVAAGAVRDLAAYWDTLVAPALQPAVLPPPPM
jgi:RNAse (barnase) inhibitor barstar